MDEGEYCSERCYVEAVHGRCGPKEHVWALVRSLEGSEEVLGVFRTKEAAIAAAKKDFEGRLPDTWKPEEKDGVGQYTWWSLCCGRWSWYVERHEVR